MICIRSPDRSLLLLILLFPNGSASSDALLFGYRDNGRFPLSPKFRYNYCTLYSVNRQRGLITWIQSNGTTPNSCTGAGLFSKRQQDEPIPERGVVEVKGPDIDVIATVQKEQVARYLAVYREEKVLDRALTLDEMRAVTEISIGRWAAGVESNLRPLQTDYID